MARILVMVVEAEEKVKVLKKKKNATALVTILINPNIMINQHTYKDIIYLKSFTTKQQSETYDSLPKLSSSGDNKNCSYQSFPSSPDVAEMSNENVNLGLFFL